MRGPLRQLGEPQRQVGGILGAKYETGLRLKGASFRVKWVKPDSVGTIWSWIRQFWHCNGPNGSWYANFDIEMSQLEAWLSLIWGWVGQLEATPTQVNAKMGYLEADIRIYLMFASSLLIWASRCQIEPQVHPFEQEVDPFEPQNDPFLPQVDPVEPQVGLLKPQGLF